MTAFAKLKNALDPLGLPVTTDFDGEGHDRYFTINESIDQGGNDGDDEPGCNVLGVQVHLFLPLGQDYLQIKKTARQAIFQAGFTYPVITMFTDKELQIRHIIFESEITEEV